MRRETTSTSPCLPTRTTRTPPSHTLPFTRQTLQPFGDLGGRTSKGPNVPSPLTHPPHIQLISPPLGLLPLTRRPVVTSRAGSAKVITSHPHSHIPHTNHPALPHTPSYQTVVGDLGGRASEGHDIPEVAGTGPLRQLRLEEGAGMQGRGFRAEKTAAVTCEAACLALASSCCNSCPCMTTFAFVSPCYSQTHQRWEGARGCPCSRGHAPCGPAHGAACEAGERVGRGTRWGMSAQQGRSA